MGDRRRHVIDPKGETRGANIGLGSNISKAAGDAIY